MKKNAILTFIFACIPGGGQMYYGYMQRGLSLISLFFIGFALTIFFEPLMMVSFIIWMYSFFDTYDLIRYLVAGTPKQDRLLILGDWEELKEKIPQHNKVLGWGLIVMGVWCVYNMVLQPMISNLLERLGFEDTWYFFDRVMPSVVFGVVLVAAGAWLLGIRPHKKDGGTSDLPPYPNDHTEM